MSNSSVDKSISADIEHPGSKYILKPLLTIFGIIFLEFLIMRISLGIIPAYVHGKLGFSNLIVGVIIGIQYALQHFAPVTLRVNMQIQKAASNQLLPG